MYIISPKARFGIEKGRLATGQELVREKIYIFFFFFQDLGKAFFFVFETGKFNILRESQGKLKLTFTFEGFMYIVYSKKLYYAAFYSIMLVRNQHV